MSQREILRVLIHTKITFPSTFFGSGGKQTYEKIDVITYGMPNTTRKNASAINLIGSEGILYL